MNRYLRYMLPQRTERMSTVRLCFTLLLALLLAGCARHDVERNAELQRLFEEDQADRGPGAGNIDWAVVGPRDEARRQRTLDILAAGGAQAAEDFYCAAMVLQHGKGIEDFGKAHELALRAVQLRPGYDSARWLAAAALDRKLMNEGRPQKYGTQYRKVSGRWELYDFDPSTTDEERALWKVPPLNQALRRAAEMNVSR